MQVLLTAHKSHAVACCLPSASQRVGENPAKSVLGHAGTMHRNWLMARARSASPSHCGQGQQQRQVGPGAAISSAVLR